MRKIILLLLTIMLVASCDKSKTKTVEVLSYDAEPEQIFSFNETDGSTIIYLAKFTPENPDYDQMYWLGGDQWIGTNRKFYPGDTLTLGDLCDASALATTLGNQPDSTN